jgi:hypothetical protein
MVQQLKITDESTATSDLSILFLMESKNDTQAFDVERRSAPGQSNESLPPYYEKTAFHPNVPIYTDPVSSHVDPSAPGRYYDPPPPQMPPYVVYQQQGMNMAHNPSNTLGMPVAMILFLSGLM